jgi:hypothetical protein
MFLQHSVIPVGRVRYRLIAVERRAMLDYIEESKARFATRGEPHTWSNP